MSLLRELAADAVWSYRNIQIPNMPLGLGVLRQRKHRLTGRSDYFWRFADAACWVEVPPERLGLLPHCHDRASVASLLSAAPTWLVTGAERADCRPGWGVSGVVTPPGPVPDRPARQLPRTAGRAPGR